MTASSAKSAAVATAIAVSLALAASCSGSDKPKPGAARGDAPITTSARPGETTTSPDGAATTSGPPQSSDGARTADGVAGLPGPDPGILAGAPGPGPDPAHVVSLVSMSRATPGAETTAVFQARPGTSCQVEVDYAGDSGQAQRLDPATADAAGLIAWTWTVPSNADTGDATAIVACSGHSRGQARLPVT